MYMLLVVFNLTAPLSLVLRLLLAALACNFPGSAGRQPTDTPGPAAPGTS